MSRDLISCRSCGAANEIVDFACRSCGEPLVSDADVSFVAAKSAAEHAVRRARAAAVTAKRIQRVAFLAFVVLIIAVCIGLTYNWVTRNVYLGNEPTYAGETAREWLVRLESDDHFMRRRAALALATLSESLNERAAREIVEPLARALEDEDEVVRERVATALSTIHARTGVGPTESSRKNQAARGLK